MKRSLLLLGVVAFTISMTLPGQHVGAQSSAKKVTSAKYAANELIVKYKKGTSGTAKKTLTSSNNAKVLSHNKALNFEVIKLNKKTSIKDAMKLIKKNKNVVSVERNLILKAFWTPNDPDFSKQYGPKIIKADSAWDVTKGAGARIAIVDTGVQANHPDLKGKVVNGHDFVDNDSVSQDGNGHGTHCAGIAAATANNNIGIAGVAPSAEIYAVRVLDNNGSGTLANVASGITSAADNNADVISLSLGAMFGATELKDAINYAWNKGSVVVAAAGNNSLPLPSYPAYYSKAIAVAATDSSDKKASYSQWGTWVDIAAPGTDIYSTYKGSTYKSLSGTSMATPHVAGVAGLLASQGKSNSEIRSAIEKNADKISGTGTQWSNGRVNAYNAVK
ncbi:thermitase Serine peptidase. MEROPS family S08A [Marininema mesophilum]|uniref:Thermitase Serine peptidase. MEROPS family S08A n=1 Tax=Marininema mesophilum TaxID=1048340 RepID=A0A1H3CLJ6_9BACL|nr:thermitase Serine peptidase. MEROPS family S08A [Marininema mesophilum]